jgi:hypothetical protein
LLWLLVAGAWEIRALAENDKKRWLISVFLFLASDALFAFPMENAFPFYTAAIASGLFLSLRPSRMSWREWSSLPRRSNPFSLAPIPILGAGLALFVASFFCTKSRYLEGRFPWSYDRQAEACRLYPANWRACVRLGEIALDLHFYPEALSAAEQVLRKTPHCFPALRVEAQAAEASGLRNVACRALAQYDALFSGRSTLHKKAHELGGPGAVRR